jgi:hypothetical protein
MITEPIPARLSKDGTRILCGRKDRMTGAYLCTGVLAPWPAAYPRPIIPPGSGLHEVPAGSGRYVETNRVAKLYATGDRRAGQPIAVRVTPGARYLSEDAGGMTIVPVLPWSYAAAAWRIAGPQ